MSILDDEWSSYQVLPAAEVMSDDDDDFRDDDDVVVVGVMECTTTR